MSWKGECLNCGAEFVGETREKLIEADYASGVSAYGNKQKEGD